MTPITTRIIMPRDRAISFPDADSCIHTTPAQATLAAARTAPRATAKRHSRLRFSRK